VQLIVQDNGIGMDENTLKRIFESFFTTKTRGEGTGLGLSTVYGIVKQNGGFLTVNSTPGEGATFTIHLPYYVCAESDNDDEQDSIPLVGGDETILLVEDESNLLMLARMILEGLGYRVLPAANPAEALRLAKSTPIKSTSF